jgi:hypothetical protein
MTRVQVGLSDRKASPPQALEPAGGRSGVSDGVLRIPIRPAWSSRLRSPVSARRCCGGDGDCRPALYLVDATRAVRLLGCPTRLGTRPACFVRSRSIHGSPNTRLCPHPSLLCSRVSRGREGWGLAGIAAAPGELPCDRPATAYQQQRDNRRARGLHRPLLLGRWAHQSERDLSASCRHRGFGCVRRTRSACRSQTRDRGFSAPNRMRP